MPTTRGIYSCDTGVVGGADNTGHQLVRHSSGWRCRQHGASTRETQEVVGGADNTGHLLVRHRSGWRCRQHGASTRVTQEWLEVPTTRGINS